MCNVLEKKEKKKEQAQDNIYCAKLQQGLSPARQDTSPLSLQQQRRYPQ